MFLCIITPTMGEPKKKIEDLTLEETLKIIDEQKLEKKRIDVKIADLKERKSKFKSEKKALKEGKSKRLKSLQNDITKTANKSSKDFKRKAKIRESASFDSNIKSKDRQVESLEKRILELDKIKKQIALGLELLKQHVNKLKG